MHSDIKKLFKKYLSGTASAEESKVVEDWFSSFDDKQQLNLNKHEKAVLFNRMDKKMATVLYKRNHYTWLKIAATLFIVLSAGFAILHLQTNSVNDKVTYQVIRVPNGVKKQFLLPDSSTVYLNSGSSITIASNFGVNKRAVTLTGEAFFMVRHNKYKPFSINTGKLQITDIGTSFDVKAYPEEKQVRVAVATGEVKVEKRTAANKAEVFAASMIRNQQLVYDEVTNTHKLSAVKSESIAAWHVNQLRFDNASFENIALQLERWYNVTVKLDNAQKEKRYTVSFGNEPVNNVLAVLAKLSGATYQINDKTISINLKPKKHELIN